MRFTVLFDQEIASSSFLDRCPPPRPFFVIPRIMGKASTDWVNVVGQALPGRNDPGKYPKQSRAGSGAGIARIAHRGARFPVEPTNGVVSVRGRVSSGAPASVQAARVSSTRS